MQRTLQLVEHVSTDAFSDGIAFEDRSDERRLALEDGVDKIIDSVVSHEVGDIDGPRLSNAVSAVLRLPVICGDPVEIVEDDLRRRRQIQPGAARDNVREQNADIVITLKEVDDDLAR